jgi:hypothetical protein
MVYKPRGFTEMKIVKKRIPGYTTGAGQQLQAVVERAHTARGERPRGGADLIVSPPQSDPVTC